MSDDLGTCEHCEKEKPWSDMHMHEDCWICTDCEGEHSKGFDTCEHNWEPYITQMGEEAQYRPNCFTAVCDDDFPSLFGRGAPAQNENATSPKEEP